MTDGLTIESFRDIRPVLVLIVTLGAILVGAMIGRDETRRRGLLVIALAGLALAIWSALRLNPQSAIGNPQSAGWLSSYLFFDPLYRFVIIFLSAFLGGVLLLSASLWRKRVWEWPVFLCMLVGSLIGMILLASSRHLLFFAIAFEMASLPSYILVGFRRFNTKSAEGSAKYVIFGAVCSALMLYGISLLYGVTGSFHWDVIAQQLATNGVSSLAVVALLCMFIGLAFKISLVPMHFWCPDAFEAAGADVAAWLSVASKSAALLALARFVHLLLPSLTPDVQNRIVLVVSVVAVVTMTAANLSAYWQTSVKRLLAYSSIAHAGYIVCGVLVFSTGAGMAAIVAYVMVYLLMNLGAFSVTGLVEHQTGADRIENFTGLGTRNPKLAAVMAFFLFSLVGLPPLAGFAVKWILLSALWQSQLVFLVAAVLANTLFSLFYYMRIARAMYFSDPLAVPSSQSADNYQLSTDNWQLATIKVPGATALVLTVCAAGLLALFIGWGALNTLSLNLFGLAN